nr:hypothetical protein [Acidobacteriota bacterium]
MNNFAKNKALWLIAVSLLWIGSTTSVFGQPAYTRPTNPNPTPKPLAQQSTTPQTSSTPLVQKTGSSVPVAVMPVARRTSIPALANIDIPGYT